MSFLSEVSSCWSSTFSGLKRKSGFQQNANMKHSFSLCVGCWYMCGHLVCVFVFVCCLLLCVFVVSLLLWMTLFSLFLFEKLYSSSGVCPCGLPNTHWSNGKKKGMMLFLWKGAQQASKKKQFTKQAHITHKFVSHMRKQHIHIEDDVNVCVSVCVIAPLDTRRKILISTPKGWFFERFDALLWAREVWGSCLVVSELSYWPFLFFKFSRLLSFI